MAHKTSHTTIVLAGLLGAALLIAAVGTAGFVAAFGWYSTQARTTTSQPTAKKVWTRDEFKALVVGKNPTEIEAAVGKPDSTNEFAGSVRWRYKERTTDPVTGKTDLSADVFFGANGRATSVGF
jgi:hypothetical protein